LKQSLEFIAGPMITLEASAPNGTHIDDDDIEAVVRDMVLPFPNPV
jgi:hypothetical protein